MKALSVMQPWASLIASGRKTIELRTWGIADQRVRFCSGQKFDPRGAQHEDGPRGVSLCDADVHCRPAERTRADADAAGVSLDTLLEIFAEADRKGRTLYAWELSGVTDAPRAPVSGKLGLFTLPTA
jgi:hypothetical protein